MAELHYEVLTDPSELRVSGAGVNEESLGSIYVSISNRGPAPVNIRGFRLKIPSGPGSGDLTLDVGRVQNRIIRNTWQGWSNAYTMWGPTTGVYEVATSSVITVGQGEVLVVQFYDFPVSELAGLVQLTLRERAFSSPSSDVTLSLLKREARVPSNFRADRTLLDPTDVPTLRWEGPNSLDYAIQGPDGPPQPVTGSAPHWSWSPGTSGEPKRDATYTLIATPRSGTEPGYFLTTTVHVLRPEFPSLTATEAVHTPLVTGTDSQQGQVSFTNDGIRIRDAAGADGTVIAKDAELETVTTNTAVHTPLLTGTGSDRGQAAFTADGVRVLDDAGLSGTVKADTVDAESVLTSQVRGRGADAGWVRFPDDGIAVGHGPGPDLGTVTAHRVRADGVNTPWVGDVDGGRGRLEFKESGVAVRKDGSQTPGDISAATADLDDLITDRAQVRERLTLQGGLTVDGVLETQDGPPRLIVHGVLEAKDELHVAEDARVGGDFAVRGDLGVLGKTNANGHLAVRAGNTWIIHTDDGQVSLQADLRVHGAVRSDG
ncbi:hypothetical protein [Streptomyces sp. NPDC058548]|uniref:hypothetical protein n=1 Tax=Streptomyces sp. NPDC058548 TaxID=3346545 RepID=UPI0036520F5B